MGVLLKSIRKILVELVDRIDSGECATTDEQERMFLDLCTMIADKERRVSKYEACRISICHAPSSTVMLPMDASRADVRLPDSRNSHGVYPNLMVVRLNNVFELD